jgi:hypothetical protein
MALSFRWIDIQRWFRSVEGKPPSSRVAQSGEDERSGLRVGIEHQVEIWTIDSADQTREPSLIRVDPVRRATSRIKPLDISVGIERSPSQHRVGPPKRQDVSGEAPSS